VTRNFENFEMKPGEKALVANSGGEV